MFRLIYKDVRAYWYIIVSQMFFAILLMSFGLFVDRKGNLTLLALMMYPLILPVTLLLMDQKFVTLCNALPCRRGTYVLSKYVGGLSLASILLAGGLFYGYVVDRFLVSNGVMLRGLFGWQGLLGLMVPIVILNSVAFPVYFRFSKEKGSVVLMVIFIAAIIALLVGFIVLEKTLVRDYGYSQKEVFPAVRQWVLARGARFGKNQLLAVIVAGTTGTLVVSILASLWLFGRKDIGGE